MSAILGIFGFITLGGYQNDLSSQMQILYAYYFIQASGLLSASTQAVFVRWHINRVLNKAAGIIVSSGQDNRADSIKVKINAAQRTIAVQGGIQGLLYVIMGAVPFLFNKHAYFLPISWLAMPILIKRIALQYNLDKSTAAKTIRQRLGLQKTTELSSAHHNPTSGGKKDGSQVSFNMEDTKIGTLGGSMQGGSFSSTLGGIPESGANNNKKKDRKKKNRPGNRSTALSNEMEQLGDVLSEQGEYRDRFTAFVRSKYASEALELYDAAHVYKIRATNPTVKQKEIEKMGKKIIADFVVEDAPKPIDMPDAMRKTLIAADKANKFDSHTFDAARTMAFDLLRSNFYFQFVNHIEHQEELLKQKAAMGNKKTSAAQLAQITSGSDMGRKKPSSPAVAAYMQNDG
jgi:hypothetical protein